LQIGNAQVAMIFFVLIGMIAIDQKKTR